MKTTSISEINRKLKKHLMEINELEETFEYLLAEQQSNYAIKGLVSMIMEYITLLELREEKDSEVILRQDEAFDHVLRYIDQLLSEPQAWLSAAGQQKDAYLNELQRLRELVTERVKVLTAYEDALEIYVFLADRAEQKYVMQAQKAKALNNEDFAGEVLEFIFKQKDNMIVNEKLKNVLRYLPVRITKQRFYDYITKSIGKYYGAYMVDLEAFIHMAMDTFYPKRVERYDELYPSVAQALKALEKTDFSDMNKEGLNHLLAQLDTITAQLQHALNLCNFAIGIINKVMASVKSCDVVPGALLEKEPALEAVLKILDITQGMLKENTGTFELSEEIIAQLTVLEGKQEKWAERIARYAGTIEYIAEEYGEVISDLGMTEAFENIKRIELLNSDNLFIVLDQYLDCYDKEQRVDHRGVNEKARQLVRFMEEHIQEMPREIYRAKMGRLMSMVPPAFDNPDQVRQYLLDTMNLCGDQHEKLAAADAVAQIVTQYG